MTENALVAKAYRFLGWTKFDVNGVAIIDPTCKFPLETVTSFCQSVVDEYNESVPRIRYFFQDHISGSNQEYGLPSNAASIINLYWATDYGTLIADPLYDDIVQRNVIVSDLLEFLINSNTMDMLTQFSRTLGVDYEVVNGNAIRILDRAPTVKFCVCYMSLRSLADIRDHNITAFAKRVAAMAIRAYVSLKENTVGAPRVGSSGMVQYGGGGNFLSMAEKYDQDWDKFVELRQKKSFIGLLD